MADRTIVHDVVEIRQRMERIEGALLRILNLLEPLILDRAKPYEKNGKRDFPVCIPRCQVKTKPIKGLNDEKERTA